MNILETAALTHSPYFHPGGETLTNILMESLSVQPGQRVLEIGCGTGATAARIAKTTCARLTVLDHLSPMLTAAKARFQQEKQAPLSLLAANANTPLPFANSSFDAVYAESVLALTQVPYVFHEIARLLHPGGKLVLNERVWKLGVTSEEVTQINALSQLYFGIPAATIEAWNKNDWLIHLEGAGFVNLTATLVETLVPANHQQQFRLSQRLSHLRQHLKHPGTYFRNLQFRFFGKRYERIWGRMEAVLFTGILKNG